MLISYCKVSDLNPELEALQGRLNFLKNRTNLSTIDLSFYVKKQFISKKEKNRFIRNFVRGWDGLVSLILGLINIWPFVLIIIGIGIFISKKLNSRHRTKKPKK